MQYKTGTVAVENGSAVVTGSGTLWDAEIAAGDIFTVAGSNVWYEAGSVDSDTQITLSANYAGATASGQSYAITRDFTPVHGIPYPQRGDVEIASLLKRALTDIDSLLLALTGGTMTGQLVLPTGSFGAPALAIGGATTGFYISSGDLVFLINGVTSFLTTASRLEFRGNSVGAACNVRCVTTLLEDVAGASVTADDLIPAGARVLGVVTRVATAIGDGNGTTGYQVGDGTDDDRWGDITGIAAGTASSEGDFTADPEGWAATAQDVVLTAVGGNFDGVGDIRVVAFYRDFTAPSA